MIFGIQGRIHAAIAAALRRAAGQAGQGTVEYVALILLIAAVLAGVIAAGQGLKGGGIAQTVVEQLKEAIEGVEARQVSPRRCGAARPSRFGRRMLGPCTGDRPTIRADARSRSSTPGSAGSPCSTSCSSSCRTRTSSTSATRRASRTATGRPRSSSASRWRSPRRCSRARAKLLVVACNSATAAALPALRARSARRRSASTCSASSARRPRRPSTTTRNGRIGLLATPATVASGAYARAVHAADPHVDLVAVPCPDLAPIIQAGSPFDDAVLEVVRGYVAPLREAGVDTVILGCTHYPLVRPMLQRMLGRGVEIVTSGSALARQVEHALGSRGLASPATGEGELRLPVHRRRRGLPRAGNALPADAARRASSRSLRRPSAEVAA